MGSFSIPGLGSGIDWNNYMSSIRQAEEGALARTLGRKQAKYAAQSTTFTNIRGGVEALRSQITAFSAVSDFKVKSVSSSDSNVVTGTASVDAANQTATIRVDQLATNEVWHLQAPGVNSAVTASPGTFRLKVRGVTTDLAVSAGTTLTQLAEQINAAGIGVTATVFDTGGGLPSGRLSIQDNASGKFNPDQTAGSNFNIEIGTAGNVEAGGIFTPAKDFAVIDGDSDPLTSIRPITEGKDSKVYLNGNTNDPIYRDSNTLTDVIPEITLALKSVDAAAFKTITVTESVSSAAARISSLIKKYNELVQGLRAAVAYDLSQSVQTNATAGDGTLRTVLSQLTNAFTSEVSTLPTGNKIKTLSDLGVSIVKGTKGPTAGTLEMNETKLNAALDANYDDVLEFFQGGTEGSNNFEGFVKKIENIVNSLVSPTNGAITGRIDQLTKRLSDLDSQIQTKLERINDKQKRLQAKFARLETQLAKLNGQQSQLGSAVNSIALNNQAIANRR